jgi:hypothetical protein
MQRCLVASKSPSVEEFMRDRGEDGSVEPPGEWGGVDDPRSAALEAVQGLVLEQDEFGDVPWVVTFRRGVLRRRRGAGEGLDTPDADGDILDLPF